MRQGLPIFDETKNIDDNEILCCGFEMDEQRGQSD